MRIFCLILIIFSYLNADEKIKFGHFELAPLANLTQEEYKNTLNGLKRKGLIQCFITFINGRNGKILNDISIMDKLPNKNKVFIGKTFINVYYLQYPEFLLMKDPPQLSSMLTIVNKYVRRYVETTIPFIVYRDGDYSQFPIPIKESNNFTYLNSFFDKRTLGSDEYFVSCMQMYDSKEYEQYLEKTINFTICKNCENYTLKETSAKEIGKINEIITIAKMSGFARCLVHYQLNYKEDYYKLIEAPYDIQEGYYLLSDFVFLSKYKFLYNDKDKIQEEIDNSIKKSISNHLIYDKQQTPLYFLSCLELYDSPEYQEEIERIVKKYCKDCK